MNAPFSAKLLRLSPKILFRRLWMKLFVRPSKLDFADDHGRHDFSYRVADPWNLSSDLERYRFEKTAEAISRVVGSVETVLEIGSAEGYHTAHLLNQCPSVDGIECSARAVARAKQRCPRARFFQGSFPNLPEGLRPRYDLAIAAESLYYIADIEAGIQSMNKLARFCLVTFHEYHTDRLKGIFDQIPGVRVERIEHPVCYWNLYIWESCDAPVCAS